MCKIMIHIVRMWTTVTFVNYPLAETFIFSQHLLNQSAVLADGQTHIARNTINVSRVYRIDG
jgi:hypothetical protein